MRSVCPRHYTAMMRAMFDGGGASPSSSLRAGASGCFSAVVVICALPLAAGAAPAPVEIVTDVPGGLPRVKAIRAITSPPDHHFVGYYGITPWNAEGTRIACLESSFGDRLVEANDRA